jgi:3-oxoacyl-[acyl-carrier-protein] synthase III
MNTESNSQPKDFALIAATGTALPGAPVDNARLSDCFGLDAAWVDTFIGTRTRHFCVDLENGAPQSTLTDLCAEAASNAMRTAGLQARDIDFLVLGTASPDELMPATVNRVADRLGIDEIPTYQLQSGCAGAIQALDLGMLLLQRPQLRTGLVLGGDVCTKHLRLDQDFRRLPASALVNYALFGDGAGAAILTRDRQLASLRLCHVHNQLTGLGQAPGQLIRWFGEADRHHGEQGVLEDYKAIEQRVPVMAKEVLWQLLEATGWAAGEVDYLLPPQLAGHITHRIVDTLQMSGAEAINCVAETGNNGNALPFLQIERLMQRPWHGKKALGIAIESSKWIKGGFALEGL